MHDLFILVRRSMRQGRDLPEHASHDRPVHAVLNLSLGLFFSAFTFLHVTEARAQGANNCAGALAAPLSLPFSATGLSNCNGVNAFTAANSTVCGSGLYLGGQDRVYAFTPTTSGQVTISFTSNSSFVGLFLYNGCPTGAGCVGSSYGVGGNQTIVASVTAGTTYYLLVDSWPQPDCHLNYGLSISAPAALPPPTSLDCFGSIPICQATYSEANSPSGEGNYPNEINSAISCLGGGEVAGQWYTFTVQNTGQFCFSIIPNNLSNDYDWAVFNLTNATCADIATNGALQVSCNFSGISGVTGANGIPGVQNNPCISVQTGQTYALYVSNWSQSPFGYTLNTQVPGSSASIFDTSPPALLPTMTTECSHTTFGITFSELVLCNTVDATDFTVSGPGGPYTVTSIFSAICATGADQANTFELTVSPALAEGGVYSFDFNGEVTDLCGNVGVPSINTLTLGGVLELTATVQPSGCGGAATGQVIGNVQGGEGAITYTLNTTTPQLDNGTYTDLGAGSYVLTATDAAGCIASVTVEVIEATTDMASQLTSTDVSCFGLGDGTVVVSTTGTGGPWTYIWTNASGTTVQTTTDASTDTLTVGPGTFQVAVVEGPLSGACVDTLVATIAEPELLTWTTVPSDTTICFTGSATYQATTVGGMAPVLIQWSSGITGSGPHMLGPGATTLYTATATDANGCTTLPTSATITVLPPLTFTPLVADSECFGLPVEYQALNVNGGDGDYLFDWGEGPQASPNFSAALPVSGTVCLTVTDGCETPPVTSCAPLEILQTPPLQIRADSVLGCAPFTVALALEDTTGAAQVTWQMGDGSIVQDDSTTIHVYNTAGNFTLAVEVTWPNGCVTDTSMSQFITVLSVPIADMTWNPRPPTINEPVVQFTDLSLPNVVDWFWDFGELGTSTDQDPVVEFPNEVGDLYPVMLVVQNALGCSDTLRTLVEVLDEFLIWVPNAFTPNGDAHNQTFFVTGNDISPEEYELLIFDRWGREVFSTTNPYATWDGTAGGNGGALLPQGVYPWRLNVRSLSSQREKVLLGHVTLLH